MMLDEWIVFERVRASQWRMSCEVIPLSVGGSEGSPPSASWSKESSAETRKKVRGL
jgi:hypothetical protein